MMWMMPVARVLPMAIFLSFAAEPVELADQEVVDSFPGSKGCKLARGPGSGKAHGG